MVEKSYTIVIKTTFTEEYIIENVKNKKEALEKFKRGEMVFAYRSEDGKDGRPKIRLTTDRDRDNAFS